MARLTSYGLDELELSMREIMEIPDNTIADMLNAKADVVLPAQKSKGRAYGVHRTGVTLNSMVKKKPRRTKNGVTIDISFKGKNADGNRNAEVAFVNEFGKRGQAPRPFIRDANEESAEKATEAAAKVYYHWIKSKGL